MTRIVGIPRNRSVYTTAINRSGKNTEPGRLRITAISSANARMITSQIMKYSMLRTNFFAMSGKVSRNSLPLKNACFTAGQFEECTTTHQMAPNTTTVLTTAMATPFAPSCRKTSANSRDRLLPTGPSGGAGAPGGAARLIGLQLRGREHRHHADVRLLGQPLGGDRLQRVIGLHRCEGSVHTRDERVALHERHPEVL